MVSKIKGYESSFKDSERILFVDDEEALVEVGTEMLELLGYCVVSTTSPIEALERFRGRPQEFDLVIADIAMPEISGQNLAQKILKIRPDIPVILCTGCNIDKREKNAKLSKVAAFLMKPFTMTDLAASVRKVLNPR
jgi:CheY-like chemotaxis protein